ELEDMKTLHKPIIAASTAAAIGVSLLAAGCAGPATRTAGKTAEQADMAKFEEVTPLRECYRLQRSVRQHSLYRKRMDCTSPDLERK
ncbi:MAG: hypothetical protein ACREX8_15030, partial [Gammaproteobacteria bacterium]